MSVSELRARVTLDTVAATAALALLGLGMGGVPAGVGIAAAGGLAAANFWWLGRGVSGFASAGRRALAGWAVSAGARFLVLAGAFVALLGSGWADPLAVIVGLGVLPVALVVEGLRAARGKEPD